jgi:hypothetical protein
MHANLARALENKTHSCYYFYIIYLLHANNIVFELFIHFIFGTYPVKLPTSMMNLSD